MVSEEEFKKMFPEGEGWDQIPDMNEFWNPELEGDMVKGVYILKETNVGRNHSDVYTLKEENEEDATKPIIHKIFGTTDLMNKFQEIEIGTELAIRYNGSKPSTPPKKPFKMFDIRFRKTDDTEGDSSLGDVLAIEWIDKITDDLLEEGVEPTERKILTKAKDYHVERIEGLTDPKMLVRIDNQLKKKG
jgi:hypothetical protein